MTNVTELNTASMVLVGACSGVYFLFNNDELVYIGQGWNCFLRVAEHTRKDSNKVFNRWNFIRIEDEEERKNRERELRAQLKPKFNKI